MRVRSIRVMNIQVGVEERVEYRLEGRQGMRAIPMCYYYYFFLNMSLGLGEDM